MCAQSREILGCLGKDCLELTREVLDKILQAEQDKGQNRSWLLPPDLDA